jgi:hypothetical protein
MKSALSRHLVLGLAIWVWGGVSSLLAQATLPSGQMGVSYSYTVSTTPPPPAGTVYSATGLPSGLSINGSSGVISGTPTASGTFTGSVSLTSGVVVNSFTYSLVIAPPLGTPVISSALTIAATVGTAINPYTVAANNATSFNVGSLPPGLSLNSAVAAAPVISGTPTAAGTYTVALSGNNATGTGAVSTLTITVAPAGPVPVVGGSLTQSAPVNQIFSYSITATQSPASYSAVPLPLGLSLNPLTGVISGTPTVSGVYAITLRATNNNGTSDPATLNLTLGSLSVVSSATAVNGGVGVAFAYQITASNTPVSYNVSGLPAGLVANLTTGLISGTPTAAGVSTVSLSANNLAGPGPVMTATFTIGNVPVITSAGTATGTVGTSLTFNVTASNAPTSYAATGLPAGLTINSGTGAITGTPTAAGAFTASVTATNVSGTGAAANLAFTIAAAPVSGGGGGGGGSVTPTVVAPSILSQPASQSPKLGASATLSVLASGTAPLSFQWYRNGTLIAGASASFYAIDAVGNSDAGSYLVVVANSAGSVTSAAATLTVTPVVTVPSITTQPASIAVSEGGSASLSVVAAGTGPLTYQWRRDGIAVAGATSASYSASLAGSYTVVVGNSAGSVTSDAAVVSVKARTLAGTYFGSFGGDSGGFALYVRTDRSGVFVGYASAAKIALISRDVNVDASGAFQFSVTAGPLPAGQPGEPARAAADSSYLLSGRIGSDGSLSGSVSGLNLSMSAPSSAAGATAALAGFYQAGAAGSSATSYAIVGAAGDAYIVSVNGSSIDAGRGSVSSSGVVAVTTAANTRISGNVGAGAVSLTASSAGSTVTYVGANADMRTDDEKLLNLSSRSQTGVGGQVLIAGFVINGTEPKTVLVRAIGPSLAAFGLNGVLSATRLELFNDRNESLKVGLDWGQAADSTAVADASARVGAFPLAKGSRDSAVLVTLAPGAYTAVVTGQGGATGVCLVEAYDATVGAIPKSQRLVNISSRALVGNGESALIGGFVITGSVPKRVLIRAVGPGLAQFGVPGVLARPQVILQQNGRTGVLAQNAGYAGSSDAPAINAAAAAVGAFALPANSADAAILINLEPGAYTAQVVGVGGATGNALVEIYELK